MHAVDVLRAGLGADEDDLVACRIALFGGVGVEHHGTRCCAGRGRQALGDHVAGGVGIERRVEQLVERHRIDAQDRLFAGNQAFRRHVDRDLERGLGGALARAGLQHPELGLFDRELDVLHVAVMGFEPVEHRRQLGIDLRHRLFHRRGLGAGLFTRRLGQILRRADAGDDVLALRIDQEFAVIGAVALGGIAGEGDAGRRRVAHIAEDHRLDVDRGAPVRGDVVEAAIDLGTLRLPRSEHRADCAPELVMDVLREGLAPFLFDQSLIFGDQVLEIAGSQLGIEGEAVIFLGDLQCFLERAMVQFEHHVGVHLDEAAIAVPGEAFIAGLCRQPRDRLVVQAEVEDRVHHSRHRHARAGADRHQQRVRCIAEGLGGDPLDMRNALRHFVAQALRELLAFLVIARAHRGADREAGGNRQADRRHFGKVRALAAEQILVALPAVRNAATETVHVLGHRWSLSYV